MKINLYKPQNILNKMNILFPHESIRPTQKELIESIKNALVKKENLIAHAPTGSGKTAACLSASLPFTLHSDLTVFFVTPKHTQHRIAIETLRMIKEKHNIQFTVVDLVGKKHMCAHEGVNNITSGDFADYCKSITENKQCPYFENLKTTITRGNTKINILSPKTLNILKELKNTILHTEELKLISSQNMLCPFEIACLLSKEAKVIIGDYHHILNPSIRETILQKTGKKLEDLIIIIDEAHNLPEKTRELMSKSVSTYNINQAIKEAKELYQETSMGVIGDLMEIMEKISREKISFNETEGNLTKEDLTKEIKDYKNLIETLDFVAKEIRQFKKTSFCGSIAEFLKSWLGTNESFTRIISKGFSKAGKPTIKITYRCLDPSIILKPLTEKAYSTICMSGTLTPIDMYKDIFGFNTKTEELPNPFPKTNKLTIVIPDTTTKYTARNEDMFKLIAKYCSEITNIVPGNSLLFFPSYDLRDKVYTQLQKTCEKTIFLEYPNLSKENKTIIIEKFKSYSKTGAILLAASSGSFGEGIDINDNIIKCVIVVGLPLSKPNLETKELINYYDKLYNKGWDYGYIMPAIIKSLQNAGRCIRSENDRGVIVFLDQRYTWQSYFKCFPNDMKIKITKDPKVLIKEFFNS